MTKDAGEDPGHAEPYGEEGEGEDEDGHAEEREEWGDSVDSDDGKEAKGVEDVDAWCVCGSENDSERYAQKEVGFLCATDVA